VAYQPYHDAVHALVADHPQCLVFSVHSFTDAYEGVRREVEVGVLFDRDEAPARHLLALLSPHYDARLNEPWDGRGGMMYSAQSHASAHGAQALEIEVRQDLLADPAWRRDLAGRLAFALRAVAATR